MLQLTYLNICILSVYRALTGNFKLFLNYLHTSLKLLYKTDMDFIVCGDMNTDYLTDSYNKKQLDTMLFPITLLIQCSFPPELKIILIQLLIISSMMSLNLVIIQSSPFTMTYLITMHKS
jgi:hypothetical protein